MAKYRKLSATRMLVELTESRKQQEFFDLAKRFRIKSVSEAAKLFGDQLGRIVFVG